MPRVLIISPEFPPQTTGGLGTHLAALSTGLAARGWTIDVVLPSMRSLADATWGDAIPPFDSFGARVHRVSASEATRALHPSSKRGKDSYVADMKQVALAIGRDDRGPVDIVHAHDWLLSPLAKHVREELSVPLVLTVHLLYHPVFGWWGRKVAPEIVAVEGDACRSADRVITVSRSMVDLIGETYGIARERIVAVHNCLDPSSVEIFGRERVARSTPLVLFAGRITRQKGVIPFVRSARLVLDAMPDARFVLAGPRVDPMPERHDIGVELRDLVASDPMLASAIEIPGSLERERLAELYREASIAVVPSVYEPFGYAALEAMCAGVPVVATNIGGLQEIVVDGETGVLVPLAVTTDGLREPDVQALADAQIELLRRRDRAEAMGAAGRRRATTAFPPERMVEETASIYAALMTPV